MKQTNLSTAFSILILLSFTLTSCEAIGGIFKAGMWFGIIGIIIVVAIILWLVGKARK
ncbi:MAG: phosphatidate cytidylyltransferase [Ginsengibacter sp.]|jgi:predicted small secreted protein